MKLLVGGDSFATFPKSGTHWSQLLLPDVTSVGVGAGDISISTMNAITAILNGDYTHMVFSVTTFDRDNIEIRPVDQTVDLFHNLKFIEVKEFYKDVIPNGSIGRTVKENDNRVFTSWKNLSETGAPGAYMNMVSESNLIHNRISNLAFLKYIADTRGVKYKFVMPFNDNVLTSAMIMLKSDVFDYMDVLKFSRDSFFNAELANHHYDWQHKEIANLFKKTYPDWANYQSVA